MSDICCEWQGGLPEGAGLKIGMTGKGRGRHGKAGKEVDAVCEARRLIAARWEQAIGALGRARALGSGSSAHYQLCDLGQVSKHL